MGKTYYIDKIAKLQSKNEDLYNKLKDLREKGKISADMSKQIEQNLNALTLADKAHADKMYELSVAERDPKLWPWYKKLLIDMWNGLMKFIRWVVENLRVLVIEKGGDYVVLAIVVVLLMYGAVNLFGAPSFLPNIPYLTPDQEETRRNNMSWYDQFVAWVKGIFSDIFDCGYRLRAFMNTFKEPQEQTSLREVIGGRCDNQTMIETADKIQTINGPVDACIVARQPTDLQWSLDTSKFDQWNNLPPEIRDANSDKLTLHMPFVIGADNATYVPQCSQTFYNIGNDPKKPQLNHMYQDHPSGAGCVPTRVQRTVKYSQTKKRNETGMDAGYGYIP